jgi:hypothetical protein
MGDDAQRAQLMKASSSESEGKICAPSWRRGKLLMILAPKRHIVNTRWL